MHRVPSKSDRVDIQPVVSEHIQVWALGTSPIILNRMSEKAKQTLLLGSRRVTAHDRASRLKHDPIAEFQASPYRLADSDAPTLLADGSLAFKVRV